jgi:hypothetical protein
VASSSCLFSQDLFYVTPISEVILPSLTGNETDAFPYISVAGFPAGMIFGGNILAFQGITAGAAGRHVVRYVGLDTVGFEQRARYQMLLRGLRQRVRALHEIAPAKDAFPVGKFEYFNPPLVGSPFFATGPPFRTFEGCIKDLALLFRREAYELGPGGS